MIKKMTTTENQVLSRLVSLIKSWEINSNKGGVRPLGKHVDKEQRQVGWGCSSDEDDGHDGHLGQNDKELQSPLHQYCNDGDNVKHAESHKNRMIKCFSILLRENRTEQNRSEQKYKKNNKKY